jgi:polyphosphate kinase 2 (PPK2 family)
MSQVISKKAFATAREKYQGRLNLLQRKAQARGVSTIMVFEGWDAAGKAGRSGASRGRWTRGRTR